MTQRPSDELPGIVVDTPRIGERIRLVHLDGEEARTTSRDALRLAGIESGDRMSAASLEAALSDAETTAAMERAIRILGHRERSRSELSKRLAADGYPAHVIESTLDTLEQWAYVDDPRFAESFVRSKASAGWGRGRIARALRDYGVADEHAQASLDKLLPVEGEHARARSLARHGLTSDRREQQREIARLVRKGFSFEIARATVLDSQGTEYDEHET